MITKYGAPPPQVHQDARQDDKDTDVWHNVNPQADTEKIVRKPASERTTTKQARSRTGDEE